MIDMAKVLATLAQHEGNGCCDPKTLEHVSQSMRRLDMGPKPLGTKHGCVTVYETVEKASHNPYFVMHTVHSETCPWRDR